MVGQERLSVSFIEEGPSFLGHESYETVGHPDSWSHGALSPEVFKARLGNNLPGMA